ncbi:MAG: formate transporter FocA [Gammaproteobacteria bacterium]|nr:formate transporter FocA [Gammaproteobacteria bacterium]
MAPLSRSPFEMMEQAEHYALSKVVKPAATTAALAMMAGLFIALGYLFFITVTTGAGDSAWGSLRLLGGVAFSIGLIMVVICGGELFTSTVLSAIAVANRQIGLAKMVRIWGWVYLGNLIGSLLMVVLAVAARLYLLDNGQWGLNVLTIAQHKLHHGPAAAFALGVLCNILVCLAIWMTFSTDHLLTKVLLMVLPVALFVSSGFEHCVANMFVVPLALAIYHWAPADFWLQSGVDAARFADLGLTSFVTANLIPVTLGNIVGGALLVGLNYWAIFRRITPTHYNCPPADNSGPALLSLPSFKEPGMSIKKLKIKDIMTLPGVVLKADMALAEALDLMLAEGVGGAPVSDNGGGLVGYLSQHDLLVALWCNDYRPLPERRVADLMHHPLLTVNGEESVIHLAEQMAINVEAVFPVSDQGLATGLALKPLQERARAACPNRPHHYPVMIQGQFKGMVSRQELVAALRSLISGSQPASEAPRKIA